MVEATSKERLLTFAEAEERLGLRQSTLRLWVRKRRIASVRLGSRTVRIPESEVERLLRENVVPPRPRFDDKHPIPAIGYARGHVDSADFQLRRVFKDFGRMTTLYRMTVDVRTRVEQATKAWDELKRELAALRNEIEAQWREKKQGESA